ncbi:tail fiber protein proximal subunit [Morganella phage vB_MmoM_MP1]|uniref:Long tail fiber proximal subunit n=1 Tax=Morganella phage vB_MmoM_MP1 TaxID=1852628 RepID=A0A192YB97_9CAUD|nr:tail fiber protein proximal subunit [Morganella phage vB_MmoM_MP1]ANM46395.1 long tail fiber proximal subunit [Morganella phage vB_MmoM_MP1]
MSLNKSFEATYGLNASGEKVINVAKADKTVLSDGVNVEFFIDQNTIQKYDPTRGYDKNFAIIYDNRIYVSNTIIDEPAGDFDKFKWDTLRVDPSYIQIHETVGNGYNLKSGEYIAAYTNINDLTFNLPKQPIEGDTIYIKEMSGNNGYKFLKVKKTTHNLSWNGALVDSHIITRPFAETLLIFSGSTWNLFQIEHEIVGRIVSTSLTKQKVSSGEKIYRRSSTGPINIELPKHAVHGDIIEFYDIDQMTAINHLFVFVNNQEHSIGNLGQKDFEARTSGTGRLVFDSSVNLWRIWDGDLRTRLKTITDDYDMLANDSVLVFGANNTEERTITINLPKDNAEGDTAEIVLTYMRKGQDVKIKCADNDIIFTEKKLLQFPKRSEYPPEVDWVEVTELVFNGTSDYVPYIKLAYSDKKDKGGWFVQAAIPTVERVDFKNPDRLGVIALATQEQANVDKDSNPEKEIAITPSTLANRTATEKREGIARISTTAEVNQISTATYLDTTIVTPKKLNERTATEDRRGLAELATQEETNKGLDDTTIVTPKKLNDRKASEELSGIAKIVASNGTPGTQRDFAGTGVYDFTNNTDIVTPGAVHELISTENAHGVVYLATETEVIDAPVMDPEFPVVVTPVQLHKKTATETRIGFGKIATQDEVNAGTDDFSYVTSKKLNDRKASETLTGLSRYATQDEFNAGDKELISEPAKIKTFLKDKRLEVNTDSGLTLTGNIWDKATINIKASTETQRGTTTIASQVQVDEGTDHTIIVTPKTLHNKKSTEDKEGIIQVADYDETIAGTVVNKAVSPKNFVNAIRTPKNGLEATTVNRGVVRLPADASVWEGTDKDGSTGTYEHEGFAVSPRELNKALSHYLPIEGRAVDSDKFNGLVEADFVRRNKDQTIEGKITFKETISLEKALTSTSDATFVNTNTDVINIGNGTKGTINFKSTTPWTIEAEDKLKINTVEIEQDGTINLKGINATGVVDALIFNVDGTKVISKDGLNTDIGIKEQQLRLFSKDPDATKINDSTIIVDTNMKDKGKGHFILRNGDTVEGDMTFIKPIRVQKEQMKASVKPVAGSFTSEIKDKAIYDTYPGIAVPVIDPETSLVTDYTYVKGPGLLTQIGDSADFVYQTWIPQALGAEANQFNRTVWTRVYNPVKKDWDEWGRVYNTNNPPTAKDIGAVSTVGSTFETLTINQWLQVGPVRLVPNPVTKTVDFVWVG